MKTLLLAISACALAVSAQASDSVPNRGVENFVLIGSSPTEERMETMFEEINARLEAEVETTKQAMRYSLTRRHFDPWGYREKN